MRLRRIFERITLTDERLQYALADQINDFPSRQRIIFG